MLETLTSFTEISLKEISPLSYLLVFLGGILASFTPCVYPLIPVTVGYIGASSATSKEKAFLLSLFYVLGIAVTYSLLGAVAALTGALFGKISTNPWTYLVAGNIFFLLGLSMLGVFDLALPGFLQGNAVVNKRRGLAGAFLVGLAAGLIISPCLTPALGAVLTYVGSKQNLFFGITLLFTFAFGMGTLLILVGTFSGIAASMPKSGKWMNIIKKLFGIILIICAEYFIILAGKGF